MRRFAVQTLILMDPTHAALVQRVTDHFSAQPGVIGVLLTGALAHGFEAGYSAVEIIVVVSDADYRSRVRRAETGFLQLLLDGHREAVAGRFVSLEMMEEMEVHASEPARFQFLHARILFARDPSLGERAGSIARYPVAGTTDRMRRLEAQVEGWQRLAHEAIERSDLTLARTAVSKLVLLGGRIVLTQRGVLYPGPRFFVPVLSRIPDLPPRLLEQIQLLALAPDATVIDDFVGIIHAAHSWDRREFLWLPRWLEDREDAWSDTSPVDQR